MEFVGKKSRKEQKEGQCKDAHMEAEPDTQEANEAKDKEATGSHAMDTNLLPQDAPKDNDLCPTL